MNPAFLLVIQMVLALLLAPAMMGLVRKCKARFQNRRGASIFQPYWMLLSLLRKEMTITKHSSWVFRAVPFVVLGSSVALALLMPTFGIGAWLAQGTNNIFLVAAIMVIGSLFLVFGGMDTASAFGGMGSSREMTLAALVEPSVILTLSTFGLVTNAWSLDAIMQALALPWNASAPFLLLTIVSFGFVVLTENARYPVDNPATHLELTMVHEAMILEYSGPYLAMLEYASALKLLVLSVFWMNLVLPFGLATPESTTIGLLIAAGAFIGKLILGAFAIAFIESTIVKMRFYRMQEFMSLAYFIGLAGLILTLLAAR